MPQYTPLQNVLRMSEMIGSRGVVTLNLVQVVERQIIKAEVTWDAGRIIAIRVLGSEEPGLNYLIPGFIDAHVHIESTMLVPSEFGRIALRHGTVASISDPHEIANVMGVDGVRFMLANARQTPFKIFFGAPSCVPATPFETANGQLGPDEIAELLDEPDICYLSEMMNFPGVLARDPVVMEKLELALQRGYPVDGHAPGLQGEQAKSYAAAGITTDHECRSLAEARSKIAAGMKILIREGSAARDFEALHPLISESPESVMLCSDDKHPDELVAGHINQLVARAVAKGHSLFDALICACINPIGHYQLPMGQLRVGDPMDAVEVADLKAFNALNVWVDGELLAEQGKSLPGHVNVDPINCFNARKITQDDLSVASEGGMIRVIEARDGDLFTSERLFEATPVNGRIEPDLQRDLLMICVINRYQPSTPAVGFIKGFGLKRGALASSVAHDSHNIVAVGTDRESISAAVNALIDCQGGVVVADSDSVCLLPLPVAGIMSAEDGDRVAATYADLDRRAKQLGTTLSAPFMTLSFMALLVIPELKLSDKGLFDGRSFQFTEVVV